MNLWELTIHPKNGWNYEDKETDTEIGWWKEGADYYLMFKGSSRLIKDGKIAKDWRQNFDFLKVPYKKMDTPFLVHKGLLKKYKSVQDIVIKKQLQAYSEGLKVHIGGFSQGAALALLAHEDFVYNTNTQPSTVVFGCPRVFGWCGKDLLEFRLSGVQKYAIRNDWVTHAPFAWMGYRHYGKEEKIEPLYPWYKVYKNHMSYGEANGHKESIL